MTQIEIFLVLAFIVIVAWLLFCMREFEELWETLRCIIELIDALCDEKDALEQKLNRREDDMK